MNKFIIKQPANHLLGAIEEIDCKSIYPVHGYAYIETSLTKQEVMDHLATDWEILSVSDTDDFEEYIL